MPKQMRDDFINLARDRLDDWVKKTHELYAMGDIGDIEAATDILFLLGEELVTGFSMLGLGRDEIEKVCGEIYTKVAKENKSVVASKER